MAAALGLEITRNLEVGGMMTPISSPQNVASLQVAFCFKKKISQTNIGNYWKRSDHTIGLRKKLLGRLCDNMGMTSLGVSGLNLGSACFINSAMPSEQDLEEYQKVTVICQQVYNGQ